MTDTSLVERVRKYQDALRTGDPDRAFVNPDDDLKFLDEIIAALSTPTSEEVAEIIELLHQEQHSALEINSSTLIPTDILVETADLLQRLDRTTQGWAKTATGYRDKYQSQCVGIHNLREQLDLVTRQREEAMNWMRCESSGNPCGTDTRMLGTKCQCRTCQKWESFRAMEESK